MTGLRRDLLFTFGSQVVAVGAGFFRSFAVPLILGANIGEYAEWQTYLLYGGLVAFLLLGFNDGFFVRFRDASVAHGARQSAVVVDFAFLALQASTAGVMLGFMIGSSASTLLIFAVALNVPLLGISGVSMYALYMSGGIARASVVTSLERLGFVAVVLGLWCFGSVDAMTLVVADLVVRAISAAMMMSLARRHVFRRGFSLLAGSREFVAAIVSGFPIMMASYLVTLLVSVVRVVVERTESEEVFANYALAFSVANLLAVLGGALGMVLFPHLAAADMAILRSRYRMIDSFMSFMVPAFLFAAFPIVWAIEMFLPEYVRAEAYVAPLLVAVAFQWVAASLNNNFYKLLGLRRQMMMDSLVVLLILAAVVALVRDNIVIMTLTQALALVVLIVVGQARFQRAMSFGLSWTLAANVGWAVVLLLAFELPLAVGAAGYVLLFLLFLIARRAEAGRLVSVARATRNT